MLKLPHWITANSILSFLSLPLPLPLPVPLPLALPLALPLPLHQR